MPYIDRIGAPGGSHQVVLKEHHQEVSRRASVHDVVHDPADDMLGYAALDCLIRQFCLVRVHVWSPSALVMAHPSILKASSGMVAPLSSAEYPNFAASNRSGADEYSGPSTRSHVPSP